MSAYRWEGRTADEWRQALNVPDVHLYDVIDSTNNAALQLADAGARTLTLVVADYQTSGRGRTGRSWFAQPGTALLCSMVFQTGEQARNAPGTAPVRVGGAVAAAIEELTAERVLVKWPNDVVLPGRGKIAGVLCEGAFRQQGRAYIVAGIGVNVRASDGGFASLADAGIGLDRGTLLQTIVKRLAAIADRIVEPLNDRELSALRQRDLLFGEVVENEEGVSGRACGVTQDGSLLVETSGGVRAVQSATVRLAETGAYPGSNL
ncbi:MAG TPA: biotin--[acetyl-CoA-carboxylase] ligase [Longimicrobiales bacterium]|nr:biotin--[acetyl-CoA-carboxylase] ligase [Longimicrobiales bacterium]